MCVCRSLYLAALIGSSFLGGASASGRTTPISPQMLSLLDEYATASITYMTALTGDQIGRLADRQTVKVADLSPDRATQVLNAVKLKFPRSWASWGSHGQWLLKVTPRFELVLESKAFGTSGKLAIQLDKFDSNLDPRAAPSGSPVSASDPPSLEEALSAAPSDLSGRVAFLGSRALDLLKPVGDRSLARAQGVPFLLAEFSAPNAVPIAALDERKATWTCGIYRQFCLRALDVAEQFKPSPGASGINVINGVPVEWLSKRPPLWTELAADGTVRVEVNYSLLVIPPVPEGNQGVGWALKAGLY